MSKKLTVIQLSTNSLISNTQHMEAFAPHPPDWTATAVHATEFCCPKCAATATEARDVWINRRSPVYTESHRRKWQEFYRCQCGGVWWAWSNDRPPSELARRDETSNESPDEDF